MTFRLWRCFSSIMQWCLTRLRINLSSIMQSLLEKAKKLFESVSVGVLSHAASLLELICLKRSILMISWQWQKQVELYQLQV